MKKIKIDDKLKELFEIRFEKGNNFIKKLHSFTPDEIKDYFKNILDKKYHYIIFESDIVEKINKNDKEYSIKIIHYVSLIIEWSGIYITYEYESSEKIVEFDLTFLNNLNV